MNNEKHNNPFFEIDIKKDYTGYQFSVFRIIFASYLIWHFSLLIPDASIIWSSAGLLSDASLNLTYGFFPNILNYWDSPDFITSFILILLGLSISLLFGFQRPWVAFLLWYGWACLFHRNNLIANPGIPMVGWLLLVLAVIPKGEVWSLDHRSTSDWKMPRILFGSAWVILALSYSISGFDKLNSSSWANGTAFIHLLENPLARNTWLREFLLDLPRIFHQAITYSALFLEIGFGILCLFKRFRLLAWVSILIMHLGVLLLIDFADLTLGVLMLHFFVIDPNWFKKSKYSNEDCIVFFDGMCGLCNSSVDTLLGMDAHGRFLCTPLQGETAKQKLSNHFLKDLDTIHYREGEQHYQKSSAILRILMRIGGVWYFASIFLLIPKVIRDKIYDCIANNRYKWFGKEETCRLPTDEERARFLD